MTTADDRHNELSELLAKVTEGDMTATDRAALAERLRDDEDARELYRSYINLHALLDWKMRQAEEASAMPSSAESDTTLEQPTPRPKSLLNWASRHPKGPAIAIAATLLIAALVVMGVTPVSNWIAGSGKDEKDESQTKEHVTEEFVAILNSSSDATWLDGTQPSLSDPRLRIGRRLAISSGFLEVKYYTGVRVVIEGPAEFLVLGKKGAHLELGRLTARVEGETAQGFAVDTPTGRVEDLGTEFGVVVSASGATRVHVFEGEVQTAPQSGAAWASQKVVAGESLEFDHDAFKRLESSDALLADLRSTRRYVVAGFGEVLSNTVTYTTELDDAADYSSFKVLPNSTAQDPSIQVTDVGGNPNVVQVHTLITSAGFTRYSFMSEAKFEPSVSGVLRSIDWMTEINQQLSAQEDTALIPAISQGGKLYLYVGERVRGGAGLPNTFRESGNDQQFDRVFFTNAVVSDFETYDLAQIPEGGLSPRTNDGDHPDFSTSGGAITFGYVAMSATNGSTRDRRTGIRNGQIRLKFTPLSAGEQRREVDNEGR